MFRGFPIRADPRAGAARSAAGRPQRPSGRADNDNRSIDGAHPAALGEGARYDCAIAPLQALDVPSLRQRPRARRLSSSLEMGSEAIWEHGRGRLNIILVSDSLAKSRSVTLSQAQVLLIALRHPPVGLRARHGDLRRHHEVRRRPAQPLSSHPCSTRCTRTTTARTKRRCRTTSARWR